MTQEAGGINIGLKDLEALLRANPLAAEQVKVIALQRLLAEKQAEIDKLKALLAAQGSSSSAT